jgi:hypothetical protein
MAVEAAFNPSVLPYVSWASATYVYIPADKWPLVYGSMQALKAHVQEYPGCQKLEAFVEPAADGSVHVHCYTVWDTPEQLDAFMERGYTFERMLADVADITPQATHLMEKVF